MRKETLRRNILTQDASAHPACLHVWITNNTEHKLARIISKLLLYEYAEAAQHVENTRMHRVPYYAISVFQLQSFYTQTLNQSINQLTCICIQRTQHVIDGGD